VAAGSTSTQPTAFFISRTTTPRSTPHPYSIYRRIRHQTAIQPGTLRCKRRGPLEDSQDLRRWQQMVLLRWLERIAMEIPLRCIRFQSANWRRTRRLIFLQEHHRQPQTTRRTRSSFSILPPDSSISSMASLTSWIPFLDQFRCESSSEVSSPCQTCRPQLRRSEFSVPYFGRKVALTP